MRYFTLRILCTLGVFGVPCGVASAQTYEVSNAVVHDNLAVYAVRGEGGGARGTMALEQALASGAVRIHAENLRELTVENFSETPVFVQFGDLLKGGTQDQVAAESLLVRPRSHATLNVFCVDPFRSTARSGEDPEAFTASANLLPSPVAELAMLTSSSTATAKRPPTSRELRQLAIWWSIDTLDWALSQRLGDALAIASEPIPQQGSAMRQYVDQLLRARRSPLIQSLPLSLGDPRVVSAVEPYVESIEPAIVSDDKIVGAVFAVNGRLVGAEIYQSNELFREMMPKLLRAYATEAIAANTGAEEPPSTDAVRSFLEAAHREPPLHDTFSGEFHVSDANSTKYIELSGADGWVHRSYLNKVRSDADVLAPEAVILQMLETGRINSQSIDDLARQDRVILERDASSGRWSVTIRSMPSRHSPAFNIGLLLILFVLPSVAEELLIRLRCRRNRARLPAMQGRRWFSPHAAAISGLLISASAVAEARRDTAARGGELMLDRSSLGIRGAWNAERTRLLARIRETGRRDKVPDEVIKALTEIVSDDVDLQRVAQPGDGFRIQYGETAGGITEIAFVSLTYGSEKRTFYRFVDADGVAGYYDESGRSARKLLLRNPVEAGLLVGRFGYREPLWTNRSTFHHGVDWWAMRTAPVHAAGDGVIEETRPGPDDHWLVRLRHDEAYQTQYQFATLASGVEPGQRVRKGQVIGFSDARTDTTVHYEVLVNDHFYDPMRIRLPPEKHLHDQELADFRGAAARIAALAEQAAPFHAIYAPPEK